MTFLVTGMSADAVREYRETTGASMMEGKRQVRRALFVDQFPTWRAQASLEDKVEYLLDQAMERELR
jgi:hypothetical protein